MPGSATARATGGRPPYSYVWSDGQEGAEATGLDAGTYEVRVTDAAGARCSASVEIGETPPLEVERCVSHASCAGGGVPGSAAVEPSGGTPPYSTYWEPDDSSGESCATGSCAIGVGAGRHTVVVVDSRGCAVREELEVQPAGNLVLDVVSTPVSCAGGADGSATVTATDGTPPYTFLWDDPAAQAGPRAQGLQAGRYTVRVSDAGTPGACVATATVEVTEPPPLFFVTQVEHDSCDGAGKGRVVALAQGGTGPYSYHWSVFGSGEVPAGQAQSPELRGVRAGSYLLKVTDAMGCTQSGPVRIEAAGDLEVTADSTRASCGGAVDGTAVAAASGGRPPYEFRWNTAPIQTTREATGLDPGEYRVRVTDADGCSTQASVAVGEAFEPRVESALCVAEDTGTDPPWGAGWMFLNLNQPTICPSGCRQLRASGGSSYRWSPAAGLSDVSIPDPLATPGESTTYTVAIEDGVCSAELEVPVQVDPVVEATISPQDAILCPGEDIRLEARGGLTYRWSPPDGLDAADRAAVVASPARTTTYEVRVTDANGCVGRAETTVFVGPPVGIGSERTICRGETVTLRAEGEPQWQYRWRPDDGSLSCVGCAHPVARPDSTTTYTVEARDPACPAGSANEASVTVTVIDEFRLRATADPPIFCAGGSSRLDAGVEGLSASALTFEWSPAIGLDDPSSPNPLATPRTSGTYSVTASSGDCSRTSSLYLEVRPRPQVRAPGPVAVCRADLPARLPLAVIGGGDGATYSWHPATGLDDPGSPRPVLSAAPGFDSTSYDVTVEEGGCEAYASVDVLVGGDDAAVDVPPAVCGGGAVRLVASGGVHYSWSGEGSFSCSGCAAPVFTPAAGAWPRAQVSVTVTDALGCVSELNEDLRIEEPPQVRAGADRIVCPGEEVELGAEVPGVWPDVELVWSPPEGLSCTRCAAPTAIVSRPITYTVTANVGHGSGERCTATDDVSLDLHGVVEGSFESTPSAAAPGTFVFHASPLVGVRSYGWSFGDGDVAEGLGTIPSPGLHGGRTRGSFEAPSHVYEASGTYEVCLRLESRCGTHTVCDRIEVGDLPCTTCRPGAQP